MCDALTKMNAWNPIFFETHNAVVTKLLMGGSNWSNEELQHYRNNSSEVEQAIEFYKTGMPTSEAGCVLCGRQIDAILSWMNYGVCLCGQNKRRPVNSMSAIVAALAKVVGLPYECEYYMVVVVADNDYVEVSVANVGYGVYETLSVWGGLRMSLAMACDQAFSVALKKNPEVTEINRVFLVGNHSLEKKIQEIVYGKFGILPQCVVDYHFLLEMGVGIYDSILDGTVKDILILDVVPMAIGVRVIGGVKTSSIMEVVKGCATIPLKEKVRVALNGYDFPIRIELLQGDFGDNCFHKDKNMVVIEYYSGMDVCDDSELEITIDIDAGYNISSQVRVL